MKPLAVLLTAAALACATAATAQTFPTKPIRIVVGFPAGGPLTSMRACCPTSCKPCWASPW